MKLEKYKKTKAEFRSEVLRYIRIQPQLLIKKHQEAFDLSLSAFLKKQAGIWSAYRPLPNEVSPSVSIHHSPHIRWAYPRVKDQSLEFYLEPQVWTRGSYGIEEPDPSHNKLIPLQDINACLIPGLAFDRQGTRLGRGSGYFDRALESYQGLKVGLAFAAQVFSENLPCEKFDVPMDLVVTEKETVMIHHHYSNPIVEGEHRND